MRKPITLACILAALIVFVPQASAERPPQKREDAKLVICGVLKDLAKKDSPFFGDGVRSDYTAEIAVDKVTRGEGVKAGDTIKVHWSHVTKRPSKPIVGAFGHEYAVKKGDYACVFLNKTNIGYEIIYNREGLETQKK